MIIVKFYVGALLKTQLRESGITATMSKSLFDSELGIKHFEHLLSQHSPVARAARALSGRTCAMCSVSFCVRPNFALSSHRDI